jgi:hypothetical protein
MTATPAVAQFVAYHDFGATTGQESTGFITTHQSGASNVSNNALDTSAKALIDYTTGATTGVLFSINRANGMDSRSGVTGPPAPGTPADPLFNVPGLNLNNGFIFVGNAVSGGGRQPDMTLTLTGLDPGLTYDLALYGDRNSASDGAERFTLGGADAATNASSTGIIDTFTTDMATRPNATAGNIVRWTGINPGADGTITILVDPDPADANTTNIAYLSALRLEEVGGAAPLVLKISQSGGGLGFEWNSISGMQYDLLSSTDLATPVATWPVYNDGVMLYEAIPATGASTSLTGVLKSGPARFFALREFPAPPLLSADFEDDDGDFTTSTDAGTAWEWGTPDSSGLGGTVDSGNDGSAKCWGTGIGNPGFYANPTTHSRLISPVIDLTPVAAAELSFAHAIDLDTGDSAVVRLFNTTTNEEIVTGVFPLTVTDADPNNVSWQSIGPHTLPVGAPIRIEWILDGTGGANQDFMGWYIDDVRVTETTP